MDDYGINRYIDAIARIDRLLHEPVDSLVRLMTCNLRSHPRLFNDLVRSPLYFPAWVSDEREEKSPPKHINLTTALVCKTIQRVYTRRRAFPSLAPAFSDLSTTINTGSTAHRIESFIADAYVPLPGLKQPDYVRYLRTSRIMDDWFPFSTSNVLWVLIRGGEDKTYSPPGYLAMFAILWSLKAELSGGKFGASVGLLPSSAYVTDSCLSALRAMCNICDRRARRLTDISAVLDTLGKHATNSTVADRRSLPFDLDSLASFLRRYAATAFHPKPFEDCASAIERTAASLGPNDPTASPCTQVRQAIAAALRDASTQGATLVRELHVVRKDLVPKILRSVTGSRRKGAPTWTGARDRLLRLGVDIPDPMYRSDVDRERYWNDVIASGKEAAAICERAVGGFEASQHACGRLTDDSFQSLRSAIDGIKSANETLSREIRETVDPVERWSHDIVRRELAYASAGNWTEFDPAELVSALEVTTKAELMESPKAVADAATRAMEALRKDGSWYSGQPYLLDPTLSLGAWAPTSDAVWTLARTLREYPEITTVDSAFEEFVTWLEGTRKHFTIEALAGVQLSSPDRHSSQTPGGLTVYGWVSERQIRPERIDVWATTFAINALLEIRHLWESRLWSICEKRFTVIRSAKPLHKILPVDLGAKHAHRLHRLLATMARECQEDRWEAADYSLVLHGPPGSSKTAITGALADLMWREARPRKRRTMRLVRVTPADFTRLGEDRVDFEARTIFDLLGHVRGVTILFDEIDDLLQRRQLGREPSFLKLVVPAMLNRLQDLRDRCPIQQVAFVVATNYIDNIEPALVRKGRIDHVIPLVYPDRASREWIVDAEFRDVPDNQQWLKPAIKRHLDGRRRVWVDPWPYKDLQEACQHVLRGCPRSGKKATADVARALRERRQSIHEPYDSGRLRNMRASSGLVAEIAMHIVSGSAESAAINEGVRGLAGLSKDLREKVRVTAQRYWRAQQR